MEKHFELTKEQRAQFCPVIGLLAKRRFSEAAQKAIDLGYVITVHVEMERGEGLHPSGMKFTFDSDDDDYALNLLNLFDWFFSLKKQGDENAA
jgi:hypothetical protein